MRRSALRVAAVQTTAGPERQSNLEKAGVLVEEAARQGAELIVLPEYFSVSGDPTALRRSAEPLEGPTVKWAAELASRLDVRLVVGSFPELPEDGRDGVGAESEQRAAPPGGAGPADPVEPRSQPRLYNTSCLIGPSGSIEGVYRKIHLFDITVAGADFHESATIAPGTEIVVVDPDRSPSGGGRPESPVADGPTTIGLSLCYDLRFPEMYRIMALLGADVVVVPSAFNAITGPAHWELLVRARAVENQVFVVAADQVGELPPGMPACHGHSMIVDPWGTILAERSEAIPGIVIADLDLDAQQKVRNELPILANRRPEAYLWPDGDRGVIP